MSSYKLASHLGISQPSLSNIEKREKLKNVTLETLEKVTHVLDCKLVYGFVPHSSYEEFIMKKAEVIAQQQVLKTQNTMTLENQSLDHHQFKDQIQLIKQDLLNKMKFNYDDRSTPLDPNEIAGLTPVHIQTMSELNAFEHANILMGEQWAKKSNFEVSIRYFKKLHQKMFGKTWKWAGVFRKTGKNVGEDAYRIEMDLVQLCDDVHF